MVRQRSRKRLSSGAVVVLPRARARPVEAEAGLAFAPLADLLEPVVDDVLSGLPEPQRRELAVALLREDPGSGRLDRRAVVCRHQRGSQALARRRPVVLAVDDLQWLDRPSARVLEFTIRRLADLPVEPRSSTWASHSSRSQSSIPHPAHQHHRATTELVIAIASVLALAAFGGVMWSRRQTFKTA